MGNNGKERSKKRAGGKGEGNIKRIKERGKGKREYFGLVLDGDGSEAGMPAQSDAVLDPNIEN